MDKKPIFTKHNIITFLLLLVIVAVVVVTKISINKIEEQEKYVPQDTVVNNDINDYIEEDRGPKPDVTMQEYNTTIYDIEKDNEKRYDFDYIEKIIKENVKYNPEEIDINFSNASFTENGGLSPSYFKDYHGIWYPDNGVVIIIAKLNPDKSNNFVEDIREFAKNKSEQLQGTGLSYLYNDMQHTVVNGYNLVVICDNASVVIKKVSNYMRVEDELAIREYTDKYYVTEDGAFLREEEIVIPETDDTTSIDVDKDLGQLPGNIQGIEEPDLTIGNNEDTTEAVEDTTEAVEDTTE